MTSVPSTGRTNAEQGQSLRAYILGRIPFEELHQLQHRLRDEVAAGAPPSLVLCEHDSVVSVGRHGSHAHLNLDNWESWRGPCRIRWVNRAGGCWMHAAGQLALYSIMPLVRMSLTLRKYNATLQAVLLQLASEYDLGQTVRAEHSAIWVASRPIACMGGAVRDWVTYHGAVLNLDPDLKRFHMVRTGPGHPVMTSLQREARRPIRAAQVRQRLVELYSWRFQLERTSVFMDHPNLVKKAVLHEVSAAC